MTNTFTIRENPGKIIKTFEAKTLDDFIVNLGEDWTIGSKEGLQSFFKDRFQVKSLIGKNRLVCR